MNRRDILRTALAAQLAAARSVAQEGEPAMRRSIAQRTIGGSERPNILWVCTDQQRYDTIEGLSNTQIRTPNLRKFLGECTTFTNAFVQAPICSPSRASFLTGRYPHTTGLCTNGQRIRENERLLPRLLKDLGYECGLAGKLHLSPCAAGRLENRIDDGYDQFWWSHDVSDTWPGHNMWRESLKQHGVKWPQTPPNTPAWAVPIDPKYSQTAWCVQKAIQFLQPERKFQPWLMSVNIFQPHHPFWPTEEYFKRYDPHKLPRCAYQEGELDNKPEYQKIDHQGAYDGTGISFAKTDDATHGRITAAYYAMIEEIDHQFGNLMKALEDSGQADNTIVIFMSDHGEMLGDHGIYWKGPYFYDCGMHVPLMLRWPGQYKAGQRVDALVELTDLAPTLLEAAGSGMPAEMQGRSLTKLLRGEAKDHRDSIYMENYDPNGHGGRPTMATALRTKTHKLAVYHSLGTGELYDLEKDPQEFTNLWEDRQHRDIRDQLTLQLMTRMMDGIDPLPRKQAPW